MDDLLEWLCAPVSPDVFLKHLQTRQMLYVSRDEAGYYDRLLSLRELDRIFQLELTPASVFDVVKEGKRIDVELWSEMVSLPRGHERVALPERLFELYSEGSTIIVNMADRVIPPLGSALRKLTRRMGFGVHANIYITPPGAQGFARHSDEHEVVALQIAGSKYWDLFPDKGDPVRVEARAGDLLYLPRLLAHEAVSAGDQMSVHIATGLYPAYGFDLIGEFASFARENVAFQQPMLSGSGRDEVGRILVEELGQQGQQSELLAKMEKRRLRRLVEVQRKGWAGRFCDLAGLPNLNQDTVLQLRPEIITVVDEEGPNVHVRFAGKTITVPRFLRVSVDFILGGNRFAANQLPGLLAPEGRLDVARTFVQFGLLEIV